MVRAMVRLGGCPELRLLSWGRGKVELGADALGLAGPEVQGSGRRVKVRLPRRAAGLFERVTGRGGEALCGRLDLFHRMSAFEPPLGRKLSRRVRQVQPLLELPPEGSREEAALRDVLLAMDAVLCGSRAGAQQAISRLGLQAERVHAVTTGADHWLRLAAPRQALDLERAGPPKLLVLGAINANRQPLALLAAFEALIESESHGAAKLVFCGHPGDAAPKFRDALRSSPAVNSVTWIDSPKEADMPELVASCTALIHLSEGELSPITPLEALTYGASVVASDLPAFREVLDRAPGAFPVAQDAGRDPAELARAIAGAIESGLDSGARQARIDLAKAHTWKANAEQTLALWSALC
jgi:glycosyltransferase involved in cell wall biosynthesis